jgi:hypothetical protein
MKGNTDNRIKQNISKHLRSFKMDAFHPDFQFRNLVVKNRALAFLQQLK